MSVLVVVEHDRAQMHAGTLNVVTAARQLSDEIHLLVAGDGVQDVAGQAAGISGVSTVLLAEGPALADGLAENLAAQVLAAADGHAHILFAATAAGKSVAPRVAAALDVAQVSEVTAIEDADTFQRPVYAGNAIAFVRALDPRKVLTIRTTGFDPAPMGGQAGIRRIPAVEDEGLSSFVERNVASSERPDLTSARIVVAGGRGLGSAENFRLLHGLADRLGAGLGASRAAVDAGYAPNDWQVGQTGKVVAPDLYVAIGISGAIQHLAGMKDSKVIVAINNDPEAPIFGVADYSLEADLFEAVPMMAQALGDESRPADG